MPISPPAASAGTSIRSPVRIFGPAVRLIFRRDEAVRMRANGFSWRAIAKALDVSATTVRGGTGMKPRDPNEGDPFEPPETDEERARRAGSMIRANVDRRLRQRCEFPCRARR